jgi:cell division protein FtsZ
VRGFVNVVYAEISEATRNSGYGFFTFGIASGESKTINALKMALSSPTVTADQIKDAKNILLYISIGQDDVTFDEIGDMIDSIQKIANFECNIIWNVCYDSNLGSDLRITIIGTGLESLCF